MSADLVVYSNGQKVAEIAQLVEQRIRNAKVGGSIPLFGTNSIFALVRESLPCNILSIRLVGRYRAITNPPVCCFGDVK